MPSPYARQMGETITRLVAVFADHVPDPKTHRALLALTSDSKNWPDAHKFRGQVRDKLLNTRDDKLNAQYYFAEACLEALYNETGPIDPFDSVSPFWVVPHALGLAATLGVSIELVSAALHAAA